MQEKKEIAQLERRAHAAHSFRVLGSRVDAMTFTTAIDLVRGFIRSQAKTYLVFSTVSSVLSARRDSRVQDAIENAGFVAPDGMPLVWLGRRTARSRTERVYGPDFTVSFIAATGGSVRHFFYGGAPGVAEAMASRLQAEHPQAIIAGTLSPSLPTGAEFVHDDVARINAAKPDVVWVGLGHPKQELWMQTHRAALDAPVLAGVGAAFDYLSGSKKEAPGWIKRSGLQWLHRLVHEPRRLWRRYLIGNVQFVVLLARERLLSGASWR